MNILKAESETKRTNSSIKQMLYYSHSLIVPAASDRGQTVQVGADEVGGGEGVLGGEGDEEGVEAGRRGHRTTVTETGRTWASAGQNKLGGPPEKKNKTKQDVTGNSFRWSNSNTCHV